MKLKNVLEKIKFWNKEEEYLDDDDYTASPEIETEKYGARNNEELADLQ